MISDAVRLQLHKPVPAASNLVIIDENLERLFLEEKTAGHPLGDLAVGRYCLNGGPLENKEPRSLTGPLNGLIREVCEEFPSTKLQNLLLGRSPTDSMPEFIGTISVSTFWTDIDPKATAHYPCHLFAKRISAQIFDRIAATHDNSLNGDGARQRVIHVDEANHPEKWFVGHHVAVAHALQVLRKS